MSQRPSAEPGLLARVAPALLLLVLAPLVAEFLLGDFSLLRLPLLLVFLPQYGGGALLIREVVRRTGRGWPSIVLLAVAYGLVEEGFTTQSLFNPNYVGQHLLAYGYLPALGTSLNWSVFVVSIHVVWSISTPILIAEGVAAGRRTTPWLRTPGLAVTAALFVIGCAITVAISLASSRFVASVPQFAVVAVLVAAAVAAAFLAFRPGGPARSEAGPAPAPWVVALAGLVLAGAFWVVRTQSSALPPAVELLAMLACEAVAVVLIALWSRRAGWGPLHSLALAPGPLLAYSWGSITTFLAGRTKVGASAGPADVAAQVLLAVCLLALVGWAAGRNRPSVAD